MRLRRAVTTAAAWLSRARPAPLLAVLVIGQFGVVAWLALATPHNGWVWYSGGDATEYWTSEWSVAHGLIPQALIGYGLPVFYAWVPFLAGASLLTGLPVAVLFNVLILGPLALVLLWALADRLYGRLYAWATATLWVIGPVLAIAAFAPRYRPKFEQYFLAPHWAGLTDMSDFPSLVFVLAAAYATVRAVENGRLGSALGAGVLSGVVIGLKPANGFFVAAAAVLLVATWRPRVALGWASGLAPAIVTLAVWKARGRGTVPLFSSHVAVREASGTPVGITTSRYINLDWHHLSVQWKELGEVFLDLRLVQLVLVLAIAGALRRNTRVGLFLTTWFVGYCVVKGMSSQADITTTSYFRITVPGFAALALLLPAIAFLSPTLRRRPMALAPESWSIDLRSPLAALATVAALLPLVVVLAEHPASTVRFARLNPANTESPLSTALTPRVTASAGTVTVSWPPAKRTGSTRVAYAIFRTTRGDGCTLPAKGAVECELSVPVLTSTEGTSITDNPGHGRFWYRVAAVADYKAVTTSTDLMLLGPAVSVRV
jgi:hypothetical protein